MNRQHANCKLLAILSGWVQAYPDLRFSQILANLEFVQQASHGTQFGYRTWVDEYHLEPDELLKRVEASIAYNSGS